MHSSIDLKVWQAMSAATRRERTRAAVLATLRNSGPDGAQAASIIRITGLSPSTVTRTLRAFCDDGTVTRQSDPHDARVTRYRLVTP